MEWYYSIGATTLAALRAAHRAVDVQRHDRPNCRSGPLRPASKLFGEI